MKEKNRTVLYVRVSTNKQEAFNQISALLDYAKSKDYHVLGSYTDIISGKETSRPQFDLMFFEARNHRRFNHLLFWDLSRFSRAGTMFTLQKLKELENLGVTWESFQEPYFNNIGEFKEVVLSIMSTIAKIERKKISERTKAGLVHAKNVGKRGKDEKPRKRRSDRGLKRGVKKTNMNYLQKIRKDKELKTNLFSEDLDGEKND